MPLSTTNLTLKGTVSARDFAGQHAIYMCGCADMFANAPRTITHAQGAAGNTLGNFVYTTTTHLLAAGAINEYTGDASADAQVSLPRATKGTALLLRFNAVSTLDEENPLTIQTFQATDVFAKQVIGIPNGATASAVVTAGTASAPTSNEILWTGAATNTMMGNGSEIWFYCPVDGRWSVYTKPVALGTGAVGVWTVATVAA